MKKLKEEVAELRCLAHMQIRLSRSQPLMGYGQAAMGFRCFSCICIDNRGRLGVSSREIHGGIGLHGMSPLCFSDILNRCLMLGRCRQGRIIRHGQRDWKSWKESCVAWGWSPEID